MKKLVAPLCFVFSLLGISCASDTGFTVPGEKQVILSNLANEYYSIAEGYFGIKNYTKAIEYYKLAMRDENLYLTAFYKLARAYALAKDWENALQAYKTLLERDPQNNSLILSVAYITAMSGKTDEAIIQYKELKEKNPYDQTILENYIALLIFVGRGEDAETEYFVLKEKFPDSSQLQTYSQKIAELVDGFDGTTASEKKDTNQQKK